MLHQNGVEHELTIEERLAVLDERRREILRERTKLEINYRVQGRLQNKQAQQEIEANLLRLGEALDELDKIAGEWRAA